MLVGPGLSCELFVQRDRLMIMAFSKSAIVKSTPFRSGGAFVRNHSFRRFRRSSALVIGLALIVGACSGDDDDEGPRRPRSRPLSFRTAASDTTADSPADTTEAGTVDTAVETTAAAETTAASAVDEPTGEPIKFAVASAVEGIVGQPEVFDGADAATAAINAAGGIPDPAGGPNRPLEVVRCEAGAGGSVSPDVALECARDTLDDGIIAVVSKYLAGADGTKRGRKPASRSSARCRSTSRTSSTPRPIRSPAARPPASAAWATHCSRLARRPSRS